MKKLISLMLALALILIVTPVPAHALTQEDGGTGQEELIAIACDAFPEHRDKIMFNSNFGGNSRSASLDRTLVLTETRNLTDNDSIIYSEYSDGLILLTYYEYGYRTTINDQVPGAGRTLYNVTIKATSADVTSAYFELRNITFTIYPTAFDRITGVGTPVTVGDRCDVHTQYSPILTETAAAKANITYRLSWEIDQYQSGGWIASILRIEVGANGFRVIHLDYDEFVNAYGYP